MHRKTMKDYISGVKPINSRNATIKISKTKQRHKALITTNIKYNLDIFLTQIVDAELSAKVYQTNHDWNGKHKTNSINPITRRAKRNFTAERTIDLHGFSRIQALQLLAKLFIRYKSENVKNVLIITGGNASRNSVLRTSLRRWICDYFSSHVSSCTPANLSNGGDGAFCVILKKNQ